MSKIREMVRSNAKTVRQETLDLHRRQRRRRDNLEGYLFITPAVVLIGLFGIFPVFYNVYVSMHRWRIRRGAFIGLENYAEALGSFAWAGLFVAGILAIALASRWAGNAAARLRSFACRRPGDPVRLIATMLAVASGVVAVVVSLSRVWDLGDAAMLDSLRITIWYSLGTVPIQLGFGLLLAVMLDQKFKGKQFFRVVFLMPYIVPTVASASIFQVLFSLRPQSFANELIGLLGLGPLGWLGERTGVFRLAFGWGATESASVLLEYLRTWIQGPSLALVSIMFFNYWVYIGYYALIYSNGLSNISRELYEAAEVDGARKSSVLFKIVIPLLSPTTFFLSLLGVIGTFKAFNSIYVLRNPATGGATDPLSVYIFFSFFRRSRFGYAGAMALLLFLLVLGLTFLQRRIMERRISYGD